MKPILPEGYTLTGHYGEHRVNKAYVIAYVQNRDGKLFLLRAGKERPSACSPPHQPVAHMRAWNYEPITRCKYLREARRRETT